MLDRGRERRGPPDPQGDIEHECRDEDGAHDEGVEQHAERDDEPDLGEEDQQEQASTLKVPASTIPADVITLPVTASPRSMP